MMLSCKQMAEKLEWAAVRAKNEIDIPTLTLMEEISVEAKSYIGHDQDEWAPLAKTTIEGWMGFPGKIELGYAPPDNPLLREGTMRESIEAAAQKTNYGAEGVVGSKSLIALWQEMGTVKNGAQSIPPRPFMAMAMGRSYAAADVIFGAFAWKVLTK